MAESQTPGEQFSLFKGGDDIVAPRSGEDFGWDKAALRVRESLHDALNAKNLAFLFGSGRGAKPHEHDVAAAVCLLQVRFVVRTRIGSRHVCE